MVEPMSGGRSTGAKGQPEKSLGESEAVGPGERAEMRATLETLAATLAEAAELVREAAALMAWEPVDQAEAVRTVARLGRRAGELAARGVPERVCANCGQWVWDGECLNECQRRGFDVRGNR